MELTQFNPYVRFFNKVVGPPGHSKPVRAYDYRLFYPVQGHISFEVEDAKHFLSAGDVIIIPPGHAYKLIPETTERIEFFLVNFDFVFDPHLRRARPPAEEHHFDEKQIFSLSCISPFETVFVGRHVQNIRPTLDEMQGPTQSDDVKCLLLRSALMKTVLTKIIVHTKSQCSCDASSDLVQDVKDYIYQNRDHKLTNTALAGHFGYHPYYLNDVFSKAEHISLHKYINRIRADRAKELLSFTELSISEIAQKMEIPTSSQFSAFFRCATGMTPREYRSLFQ